jgi:hypothetical protein
MFPPTSAWYGTDAKVDIMDDVLHEVAALFAAGTVVTLPCPVDDASGTLTVSSVAGNGILLDATVVRTP